MKRSKKKQLQKIEDQDALGISRRVVGRNISLSLYVKIKFACIAVIPIAYFVYSPLLVLCLAAYTVTFFLAIMAERRMNVSVIKRNHIKIFKFDSAVAVLIIVIALFGSIMGGTDKLKRGGFDDVPRFNSMRELDFEEIKKQARWNNVKRSLKNFGAALTGERSIFKSEKKMQFGNIEPPEDFPVDMGEFQKPDMPDFKPPEFSIEDLPIEYMFSSMLSSVNTVLVFSVSILGVLSLIALYIKKRNLEFEYSDPVISGKINVSEQDIDRILSFGVKPESTDESVEDEIKKE